MAAVHQRQAKKSSFRRIDMITATANPKWVCDITACSSLNLAPPVQGLSGVGNDCPEFLVSRIGAHPLS